MAQGREAGVAGRGVVRAASADLGDDPELGHALEPLALDRVQILFPKLGHKQRQGLVRRPTAGMQLGLTDDDGGKGRLGAVDYMPAVFND